MIRNCTIDLIWYYSVISLGLCHDVEIYKVMRLWFVMFNCFLVNFPCVILGQMLYFIVLNPGL